MKNRFYSVLLVMALSSIFISCEKEDNDEATGEDAKSVKEYNGFLWRDDNKNWAYAQEKITVKEFDTYLEIQAGNNSVQSKNVEKGDNGTINKVTFNREWNYYPPNTGQLGLAHSNNEPFFVIQKVSYGSSGGTVTELRQIVLSPDIEWCRTKHNKSAYNQIIVISNKTNQSILSIL
jgi:hypothetical protein